MRRSVLDVCVLAALAVVLGVAGCTGQVIPGDGFSPEELSAATDEEPSVESAQVSDCARPHSDGKHCDDGLFCTVRDRCDDGVCVGEPRACANGASFCETPVCDEDANECLAQPSSDPTCDADKCSGKRQQRAYQRGFRRAWKSVQRSWDRRFDADCDQTEAFVDRVIQRIEDAQERCDDDDDSKFHQCRIAGATAGAFAALDAIQLECDESCFLDGELVGELSAKAFCELAIGGAPPDAEEWVRGPLNLCGLSYEFACDSSYIGTSSTFENADGTCAEFTEGAFFESWDRTRLKTCDYANRPD